jgi:hypothetical protein
MRAVKVAMTRADGISGTRNVLDRDRAGAGEDGSLRAGRPVPIIRTSSSQPGLAAHTDPQHGCR